jgi:UDPglucose 6-dehydrogenase
MINNLMEICHNLPNTNIDVVSDALSMANRRLISNMYMRGGMGDGGGCHPRDNIAMSWLNDQLGIENNYYEFIIKKREDQSRFLANLISKKHCETKLPICILGKSFKPETNLLEGSPSLLLKYQLEEMGYNPEIYDPYVDKKSNFDILNSKKIFIIGTKHQIFKKYQFPDDSIIIDPHRYLDLCNNSRINYIGVGIGNKIC